MQSQYSFFPRFSRVFLITVLPVTLSVHTVMGANDVEEHNDSEPDVVWHTFNEAQSKAAIESKPLFIFVEADWCVPCKQMKSEVFPREEVSRLLNQRYYAVSIDVDSRETLNYQGETLSERAFVRTKRVTSTPTMIFLEPDGTELGRRQGAVDSDELITLLKFVDSEHFGNISQEEFKNMDQ